jgi:uroporphyrinogen-III synthase
MKLILTRPEGDSAVLSQKLKSLGHEVLSSPLLEIVQNAQVTIPDRPWAAILVTSANGIRHLPPDHVAADVRVIAVGEQSAEAARICGFHTVESHGGDVTRLAAWITGHVSPSVGPLLYVTGKEISGDLAGALATSGFDVHRVETYQAVARPLSLSARDIAASDGVLLYSPRSAKLWVSEIRAKTVMNDVRSLRHFCLSQVVADQLPQDWLKVVASEANESALLELLEPATKGE